MNIEIVNTKDNNNLFNFATELIFNEWGDGNVAHLEQKRAKLRNNQDGDCFVLLVNNIPVGCFVICTNDIPNSPHLNPNLACVCITKDFRGQGFSRILMQQANQILKNKNIQTAYLKTTLINFYEKFGWEHIDNIVINDCLEKIYKINLQ